MKQKNRLSRRALGLAGAGGGLAGLILALALAAAALAADVLIVTQKESYLRKTKSLLGPKVTKVQEGDELVRIEEDDTWFKAEAKGSVGWIPRSSVSQDRKVVLSGDAVAGGVRATEQSAGVRYFNPEVERQYRAGSIALDAAYKVLDRIETRKTSEDAVTRFLREGRLGDPAAWATAEAPRPAASTAPVAATPPWKR